MDEAYSIRDSLQGRLQSYIRESGFRSIHAEDFIRDLVVLLISYREEGLDLFPEVYVIGKESDRAALLTSGHPLSLGSCGEDVGHAAATVLKECAPLAIGGWAIFTVFSEATIQYGMFRATRHSLSTSADEAMVDLGKETQIMLVRNRGLNVVELQNTSDVRLTAAFRISPVTNPVIAVDINRFVDAVVASLSDTVDFKAYLSRLLIRIVQKCHGSLLAVVAPFDGAAPSSIKSGVSLVPHLDLFALHTQASQVKDAESLAALSAIESIIEGMINSDGIVMFGSDGTVRAFRAFIKPENAEAARLPAAGGGRRRTYELLKLRIPAEYTAAFFRSQDGETRCEGVQ